MIDDIARAAVAPQIAVADEINYTNFVSKLKNLPVNKPKMNVILLKPLSITLIGCFFFVNIKKVCIFFFKESL